MGHHHGLASLAGADLRRLRHAKALTLVEVAAEAGVSAATLSRLERTEADHVSLSYALAVLRAFEALARRDQEGTK